MVHPTVKGDTPHSSKLINVSTTLPYFLDSQTISLLMNSYISMHDC
jgi:hypothetical protein